MASSNVMEEGSVILFHKDVDGCDARCQGMSNVFGSGGILEGSDDVSKA